MLSRLGLCIALLACTSWLLALPGQASDDLIEDFKQRALFYETFDEGWDGRWIHSNSEKYTGRFVAATPEEWDEPGLKIPEKGKHYGLAAMLPAPLDLSEGLVVQYEVRFTEGVNCGGAYVKLLSAEEGLEAAGLGDSTPYSIMFGPDKCGGPGKVHLILRHRNPVNGTITEKHLRDAPVPNSDTATHVYTLIITPQLRYEILIDGVTKTEGSLLSDLEPPINPPDFILDPEDIKPHDWVDVAKIPDPEAVQPADWDMRPHVEDLDAKKPSGWLDDQPPMLDDPKARKPSDWDDEEDGEWSPPQIPNPKCKIGCGFWERPMKKNPAYSGVWKAPMIPNPEYKGPWVQKTLPNPDHFVDPAPLKSTAPIGAVAFELWTIDSGYVFDNLLVDTDKQLATNLRYELFAAKKKAEEKAQRRPPGTKATDVDAKFSLAGSIIETFDKPSLIQVKPYVQPLLDALQKVPELAYALIGVPPLIIIIGAFFLSSGFKVIQDVGRAKKNDITGEDDPAVEEQELAAAGTSGAAEGDAAADDKEADAAATTQGEITPEEGEDEPGEASGATRRRTRRAD